MKNTTLCYVEQEGKYLMLLRNKKKQDENAGKWIGVGGKFEEGESPQDCLLREVQEERGGALPAADLAEIAAALSLRDTFLSAIIRRYPGLRTEEAPHRLELCGGPRCSGRGAARLAAFVEETYGVRPGGVSASGRFTYRITGCMKNCPNGPSLRWDGALHSRADEALIRALVDEGGGRPSP